MAGGNTIHAIQVTNIAPQATKDQMQTLFGHVGKIEDIRLYPTARDISNHVQSRICYIRYYDSNSVLVAQHLTNTVFIDRALIVIPVRTIPDEYVALEKARNGTLVPGLHKPDAKLPPEVVNRIEGQLPQQVIKTYDPKLEEHNLPAYPALPAFYDARRVEETRRTIIICDVRKSWDLEDLMDCFQAAGEVKFARFAEKGAETYCMLEFCEQASIINALKMQGQEFKDTVLNIYHSTDAITKPETKSNEVAQKEISEALAIVKEQQNMISAAIDPVINMFAKEKRSTRSHSRSRSRSRERRRSGSREHRHTCSRSRSHRRSRSKRHSRTRSRSRSRRSPHNKPTRQHTRSHRSRSRRRSLSAKRGYDRHHKSRSRSQGRRGTSLRERRTRSREHARTHMKRTEDKYSSRSHTKRRSPSPSPEYNSRRRSRDRYLSSKTYSKTRRSRSSDRKLRIINEENERRSTR